MLEALLLDALLLMVILLMIPIGIVRGGLREICTSAGLLLGILLAQQWAPTWGTWLADTFDTNTEASTFITSVGVVVLTTALVGYGASSSFNYTPGPGGKMFGAAIATANGIVVVGFVVNAIAIYMNDGAYPSVVEEGQLTRAISRGFDWTLLIAAAIALIMSLIGMMVRERDSTVQQPAPAVRVRQVPASEPAQTVDKIEPPTRPESVPQAAPVKIKEVRHWETEPEDGSDMVSTWQRTWPTSSTGERIRPPWEPAEETRAQPRFQKAPPASEPRQDTSETLRKWMEQEEDS